MKHHPDSWVGFDLDGCLADSEPGQVYNPLRVGKPIPAMVERAKSIMASGMNIRILTARACDIGNGDVSLPQVIETIEVWCEKHLGRRVPVTCSKDYYMVEFYDDRAIQVEANTGRLATEVAYERGLQDSERYQLI